LSFDREGERGEKEPFVVRRKKKGWGVLSICHEGGEETGAPPFLKAKREKGSGPTSAKEKKSRDHSRDREKKGKRKWGDVLHIHGPLRGEGGEPI